MNKLKKLWNSLPDSVKRVIHAAWQAGGAVLLVRLRLAHSTADVQASFMVAGTVALSALKGAALKLLPSLL